MSNPAGFTGITSGDGPQASAFSSIMESIASQASVNIPSKTATQASITAAPSVSQNPTPTQESTEASTASSKSIDSTANLSKASTDTVASSRTAASPTTFSTSTISSQSDSSSLLASHASSAGSQTDTATNAAASATSAGVAVTVNHGCNSVSCSSGLQAAIAVPVVLAVLLLLGLCFCLARRRRRRPRSPPPVVAGMSEKPKQKKKWSRHLRVFSFGEELLMGGRFSSTNSLRTGEENSTRERQYSAHSGVPSEHSVDEVAPPYRDHLSTTERNAVNAANIVRPSSTATAPPPYPAAGLAGAAAGAAAGRTSRAAEARPTTPKSNRSRNDPFRDAQSNPVSPIENSPFNDPDDDDAQSPRPLMSRQSSMLSRLQEHDAQSETSTLQGEEAASIHEATLARNVSMSGARTVTVSRQASQRGSSGS